MAYIDLDIYGREYDDGTPYYHTEDSALNSALIGWITSKRGDFIRDPLEGGPLDSFKFKNMTNSSLNTLKFSLTNALYTKFGGQLELNQLDIIPNRSARVLQIDIYYTSLLSNRARQATLYVNEFPDIVYYKYQDVAYTEDTLYNFCELKKPSMQGRRLIYNIELESWVWGKFKFINLTQTDSRFADLLLLLNT